LAFRERKSNNRRFGDHLLTRVGQTRKDATLSSNRSKPNGGSRFKVKSSVVPGIRLFHSVHASAYIVLARQLGAPRRQDLSLSLTVLKLALDNLVTGGVILSAV